MKKVILSSLLIGLTPSINAQASNEITFLGEVTANTCVVNVEGLENSPTVLLPTVSTSELTDPTTYAGGTEFDINVTGCTVDAVNPTNIGVKFVANRATEYGNLTNTGTADKVEIAIKRSSTYIDFSVPVTDSDAITIAKGETSGSATYNVEYYTHAGSATAGSVVASVQYAITYL
ncbi:type 1 fimbrial protein [Shewanella sp. KX20019]|uniref:fimbrial protein n=1 Tax=Shewanella sp. KX20019 TaxID=2803864 RepID=UPI0019256EE2|nr:fimbrial protein [Shewanella sp. KX20019]QQX79909.1 type 1 fimbrial protein [Shewanella sp. KX20019]